MRLPDATKRAKILDKATVWIVAIAIMLGVIGLSWGVYEASQAKALAEQTQGLVRQLRTTQIENTNLSNQIATCELGAFNAILFDARLAFGGDKNPNDYKVAVLKC